MKTMKRLISAMLTLLLIFGMSSILPVMAVEETEEWILTEAQVIQAVQPLKVAQSQFYDIGILSVEFINQIENEDGTVDLKCYVTFPMCLKAESVEELPYIAGMLNGVGIHSLDECQEIVQDSILTDSPSATISETPVLSEDTVIAFQTAEFINSVAENIGEENELSYGIILNVSPAGTINTVQGFNNQGAFPLSEYYPETEREMYVSGCAHAEMIVTNAETVTAEINSLQVPYYRVDARDYANRFTSNATTTYGSGTTMQDPTKYNLRNYSTFYTDNDCANYVSQAIRYGGIPTTSVWQPYTAEWRLVPKLIKYFRDDLNLLQYSNYDYCNAGGLLVQNDSAGEMCHIMMCVLNDTVNHAYSAHTNDQLMYTYIRSFSVTYYLFRNRVDGTQYEHPLE